MSGSVVASTNGAAAEATEFWRPLEPACDVVPSGAAHAVRRAHPAVVLPLPSVDPRYKQPHGRHSHHSGHHPHHGEHSHRIRWRERPKWPFYLKSSLAAATVFTALLSWFWLLIGSCEPAFVPP